MDPIFGMQVRFFEGTAVFVQKLKLTGGDYNVTGYLQYGACNDENCLPPTNVEFSFKGEATGGPTTASETTDSKEAIQEITGGAFDSFQLAFFKNRLLEACYR